MEVMLDEKKESGQPLFLVRQHFPRNQLTDIHRRAADKAERILRVGDIDQEGDDEGSEEPPD